MKRTPLKPGNKPLKRKTPLRPGNKPLSAKKGLAIGKTSAAQSGSPSKAKARPKEDKWRKLADRLWRELIQLIWNHSCAMCGRPLPGDSGHNHHLIGRAVKLFRHHYMNGILLCMYCHEHDPKAPHVSPEKFMEWLWSTYPVVAEWVEENQGKIGSGKPDYQAVCTELEKLIEEWR